MHASTSLRGDGLAAAVLGDQHLGRPGLVDHVDRLVRQLAVADVAMRELDRGAQRVARVADLVVPLVIGLQAAQDLDRILDRRLVDVDLLKTADERSIFLEIVAIFLVGGRADTADHPAGKRRFQQVRGIHRPAACRACADHRVDLVDEQNGAGLRLELGQHRLEPFFEIAAITSAREKRAHIEGVDRRVEQYFGYFTLNNAPRQALGDRRLADTRLADIERIVLGPPAQDLDRAFDLRLAADQRIDPATFGLLV